MRAGFATFCAVLALLPVVALSTADDASAQSRVCRSLQKQLNSASSGGGNSAQYRRYDKAVKDQSRQIKKTKRAARSRGCSGFSRNSSQCRRLNTAIKKMSANLSKLKRTRSKLSGGGSSRKKKRIQAAMRQKGCFDRANTRNAKNGERKTSKRKNLLSELFSNNKRRNRERADRRRELQEIKIANREEKRLRRQNRNSGVRVTKNLRRRSSLVEQVFGVRTYNNDSRSGSRQLRQIDRSNEPIIDYNTYRTMCVRVRDGYYFPVSFSTTQSQFSKDEQACQQLCPGSETKLYYHRMPSESAEDMISYRSRTPYASEPFAFNYRKNYDPKISCRYAAGTGYGGSGFSEVAGADPESENQTAKVETDKPREPRIGTPVFRPDRASDIESTQNIAGNLTLKSISILAQRNNAEKPVASLSTTTDGRQIRAVGPKFFPVQ